MVKRTADSSSDDANDEDYDFGHSDKQKARKVKRVKRRTYFEKENIRPDYADLTPNKTTKFQAEEPDENLSFASMGGLDETIDRLQRKVMALMHPKNILTEKFGMKPPKGIIFHGPPGTGKTVLAKALASELSKMTKRQFSFFYRKGADLLSSFVGESENNMKLLFDEAKANKPSLIFFDEIDSICASRSNESHNEWRNSIVGTILSQMDNLDRGEVLVIGATNRLSAIDIAFRRPGRFDIEIGFTLPNHSGRKQILKVHFKKWDESFQPNEAILEDLAGRTAGFTGADLEHICSEALACAFERKIPTSMLSDKRTLDKHIKKFDVNHQDWQRAINMTQPSNSNVFGSNDFAGIPVPASFAPLISGIRGEITEWIRKFLSCPIGGFHFSVIWSLNLDSVEFIDDLVVPAALTSLVHQERKIVVLSEEKIQEGALTNVLETCAKSNKTTLLFIPRLDHLHHCCQETLLKFFKIQRKLREGNTTLAVISTIACTLKDLDGSFFKHILEPKKILEIRTPNKKEIREFLTPPFEKLAKNSQVSISRLNTLLEKLVNGVDGSDLENLAILATKLNLASVEGRNITHFINQYITEIK